MIRHSLQSSSATPKSKTQNFNECENSKAKTIAKYKKIYTDWANHYLKENNKSRLVVDLQQELQDGILLSEIIHAITKQKVEYIDPQPKDENQKLSNIQKCLRFLENLGIDVANFPAKDINEGNLKAILGLFFNLSRYNISNIDESCNLEPKNNLSDKNNGTSHGTSTVTRSKIKPPSRAPIAKATNYLYHGNQSDILASSENKNDYDSSSNSRSYQSHINLNNKNIANNRVDKRYNKFQNSFSKSKTIDKTFKNHKDNEYKYENQCATKLDYKSKAEYKFSKYSIQESVPSATNKLYKDEIQLNNEIVTCSNISLDSNLSNKSNYSNLSNKSHYSNVSYHSSEYSKNFKPSFQNQSSTQIIPGSTQPTFVSSTNYRYHKTSFQSRNIPNTTQVTAIKELDDGNHVKDAAIKESNLTSNSTDNDSRIPLVPPTTHLEKKTNANNTLSSTSHLRPPTASFKTSNNCNFSTLSRPNNKFSTSTKEGNTAPKAISDSKDSNLAHDNLSFTLPRGHKNKIPQGTEDHLPNKHKKNDDLEIKDKDYYNTNKTIAEDTSDKDVNVVEVDIHGNYLNSVKPLKKVNQSGKNKNLLIKPSTIPYSSIPSLIAHSNPFNKVPFSRSYYLETDNKLDLKRDNNTIITTNNNDDATQSCTKASLIHSSVYLSKSTNKHKIKVTRKSSIKRSSHKSNMNTDLNKHKSAESSSEKLFVSKKTSITNNIKCIDKVTSESLNSNQGNNKIENFSKSNPSIPNLRQYSPSLGSYHKSKTVNNYVHNITDERNRSTGELALKESYTKVGLNAKCDSLSGIPKPTAAIKGTASNTNPPTPSNTILNDAIAIYSRNVPNYSSAEKEINFNKSKSSATKSDILPNKLIAPSTSNRSSKLTHQNLKNLENRLNKEKTQELSPHVEQMNLIDVDSHLYTVPRKISHLHSNNSFAKSHHLPSVALVSPMTKEKSNKSEVNVGINKPLYFFGEAFKQSNNPIYDAQQLSHPLTKDMGNEIMGTTKFTRGLSQSPKYPNHYKTTGNGLKGHCLQNGYLSDGEALKMSKKHRKMITLMQLQNCENILCAENDSNNVSHEHRSEGLNQINYNRVEDINPYYANTNNLLTKDPYYANTNNLITKDGFHRNDSNKTLHLNDHAITADMNNGNGKKAYKMEPNSYVSHMNGTSINDIYQNSQAIMNREKSMDLKSEQNASKLTNAVNPFNNKLAENPYKQSNSNTYEGKAPILPLRQNLISDFSNSGFDSKYFYGATKSGHTPSVISFKSTPPNYLKHSKSRFKVHDFQLTTGLPFIKNNNDNVTEGEREQDELLLNLNMGLNMPGTPKSSLGRHQNQSNPNDYVHTTDLNDDESIMQALTRQLDLLDRELGPGSKGNLSANQSTGNYHTLSTWHDPGLSRGSHLRRQNTQHRANSLFDYKLSRTDSRFLQQQYLHSPNLYYNHRTTPLKITRGHGICPLTPKLPIPSLHDDKSQDFIENRDISKVTERNNPSDLLLETPIIGSTLSLYSNVSSLYSTPEEKCTYEIMKLKKELEFAHDKVYSLTNQLSTNASVVAAFEQSLMNMTNRFKDLNATALAKDDELNFLRNTIQALKQKCQLTNVELPGLNKNISMTEADNTKCDYSNDKKMIMNDTLNLEANSSSLSSKSISRHYESDGNNDNDFNSLINDKKVKKKKNWLRSSFTKAFSRNKKGKLQNKATSTVDYNNHDKNDRSTETGKNCSTWKEISNNCDSTSYSYRSSILSSNSTHSSIATPSKILINVKNSINANSHVDNVCSKKAIESDITNDNNNISQILSQCNFPTKQVEMSNNFNQNISMTDPKKGVAYVSPSILQCPSYNSFFATLVSLEISNESAIKKSIPIGYLRIANNTPWDLLTRCLKTLFREYLLALTSYSNDQENTNNEVSNRNDGQDVNGISFYAAFGRYFPSSGRNISFYNRRSSVNSPTDYNLDLSPEESLIKFSPGHSQNNTNFRYFNDANQLENNENDITPYDWLNDSTEYDEGVNENRVRRIDLHLKDSKVNALDSFSAELLIPKKVLQRYTIDLVQYKSMAFIGPVASNKSKLAFRIAQYTVNKLKNKENGDLNVNLEGKENNFDDDIAIIDMSHRDIDYLHRYLSSVKEHTSPNLIPRIIIVDNLSHLQLGALNGCRFGVSTNKSPLLLFTINLNATQQVDPSFDTFWEKLEALHLDFKWVILKSNEEPLKGSLHRHLTRRRIISQTKLKFLQYIKSINAISLNSNDGGKRDKDLSMDTTLFDTRICEWVCTVWCKINECLTIIYGSMDSCIGPKYFMNCPLHEGTNDYNYREATYEKGMIWFITLWDNTLHPHISTTILSSSLDDLPDSFDMKKALAKELILWIIQTNPWDSNHEMEQTYDLKYSLNNLKNFEALVNRHDNKKTTFAQSSINSLVMDNEAHSENDPLLNMLLHLKMATKYNQSHSDGSKKIDRIDEKSYTIKDEPYNKNDNSQEHDMANFVVLQSDISD
ncbi:unnamed protein product [Gordionus sp. m RMFG-2023]